MARAIPVPITPAVLDWAIRESGYSLDDLASALGVPGGTVRAWLRGPDSPSLTQFRKLAAFLKRPEAAFLLPQPPEKKLIPVQFRHTPDSPRTTLNPSELHHLREAARLQRALRWLLSEMDSAPTSLPTLDLGADVERAAVETRRRLQISVTDQLNWSSAYQALREWRSALERSGVLVFLLQLGEDSCRGFSVWDPVAPVIAVNTWWSAEARIFTLFHEYGHLLTRTDSVCSAGKITLNGNVDPAERWCERFAAAVLLPWPEVSAYLRKLGWTPGSKIHDLEVARSVSRKFKVSLRAVVLRLIDESAATWDLYDAIPPVADRKPQGGGPGEGRRRRQIREDQYGRRAHELFATALKKDIVSRGDVLSLLDITDADLDHWTR